MIGRVAGRVDYRGSDHVLIDAGGVGYIVYVSDRTLAALPGPGGFAALYTDLVVREDLLQLFGFPTLLDKEWHRLLTTVQGVGAKASMAILGTLGPDGVARAILLGDWNAVRAAPGVGPKLAQRVVNELKEKAPSLMALAGSFSPSAPAEPVAPGAATATGAEPSPPAPAPADPPPQAASAEALSALINLGYGQAEAAGAVARAGADSLEADTSTLIRAALKLLAPKG